MDNIIFIIRIIPAALITAAPVLIAAAGGLISERAGVINIALEGLMTFGAMAAEIVMVLLDNSPGYSVPAAIITAAFAGGIFSLIHAFASITLNANQIISGTGINLLSSGITVFVFQILFRMDRSPNYRIGWRLGLFGFYSTIWIALLVFTVVCFILYKLRFGFHIRGAGENPEALICAGINVNRIRYTAVFISGILAGLAGGFIALTQNTQFNAKAINGKGFIAFGIIIIGKHIFKNRRLPLGIITVSFIFGLFVNIASILVNLVNFKTFQILPAEIFNMFPFLITLLALIILGNGNVTGRKPDG